MVASETSTARVIRCCSSRSDSSIASARAAKSRMRGDLAVLRLPGGLLELPGTAVVTEQVGLRRLGVQVVRPVLLGQGVDRAHRPLLPLGRRQPELLGGLLAHLHLADLAGHRHRELVDQQHVARDLVVGELAGGELAHLRRVERVGVRRAA